jgi:predicted nucleic acid-binding protein
MRVFLDANILFSAAYVDDSSASRLFGLQAVGVCRLLTSAYALDEARRNIAAKRPKQSAALESFVGHLTLTPEPSPDLTAEAVRLGLPAKDAPVLAAAIAGKADALITGDRAHFGHLYDQTVAGVRVVRLTDAFALLVG